MLDPESLPQRRSTRTEQLQPSSSQLVSETSEKKNEYDHVPFGVASRIAKTASACSATRASAISAQTDTAQATGGDARCQSRDAAPGAERRGVNIALLLNVKLHDLLHNIDVVSGFSRSRDEEVIHGDFLQL